MRAILLVSRVALSPIASSAELRGALTDALICTVRRYLAGSMRVPVDQVQTIAEIAFYGRVNPDFAGGGVDAPSSPILMELERTYLALIHRA